MGKYLKIGEIWPPEGHPSQGLVIGQFQGSFFTSEAYDKGKRFRKDRFLPLRFNFQIPDRWVMPFVGIATSSDSANARLFKKIT